MRRFNTEGPVVAADHYCIPPLERVILAEVLGLVRDKRYFVLHAPRQTGKTSVLLALRDLLNSGSEGDFRCVYVNVEAAQAVREDVERAMRVILGALASRARSLGDEFLHAVWPDILATFGDGALGGPAGLEAPEDRFVIECKVLHKSLDRTIREGLEQTAGYMDRCGSPVGHLVIFDRSESKRWEDKIFRRDEHMDDRTVTVWGM